MPSLLDINAIVTDALTCNKPVRGSDEPCHLPLDHRGYHSATTFDCDGCGRTYRGNTYRTSTDRYGDPELGFCFLCVKESERPQREIDYAVIE